MPVQTHSRHSSVFIRKAIQIRPAFYRILLAQSVYTGLGLQSTLCFSQISGRASVVYPDQLSDLLRFFLPRLRHTTARLGKRCFQKPTLGQLPSDISPFVRTYKKQTALKHAITPSRRDITSLKLLPLKHLRGPKKPNPNLVYAFCGLALALSQRRVSSGGAWVCPSPRLPLFCALHVTASRPFR